MQLQFDLEAPQSKWTYHVLIYPHYPPVWVLLGTCLDLMLDLMTESAMGGMTLDLVSSTGIGEPDVKEKERNPEVETGEDGVDKE